MTPSLSSFLSSSPHLINSRRHCVSLVLPLQCRGCITAPSPSNAFPMLRPSCHVVMPPSWEASLCKLFRNAWILSVLLCSRHRGSLSAKSSSRPPTTDKRCYTTQRHKPRVRNVTALIIWWSGIERLYNVPSCWQLHLHRTRFYTCLYTHRRWEHSTVSTLDTYSTDNQNCWLTFGILVHFPFLASLM